MNAPTIDIRILQLVCSRLCHDLAGPIGAVNNGLELVADMAGQDREALDLIAESARRAAVELEFARLAFGFGGSAPGAYLGDAERLCRALLANNRVTLAWQADAIAEVAKDSIKLLMNMALVGEHLLKGRGDLSIRIAGAAAIERIEITAAGPGAALADDMRTALAGAGDPATLTPILAQAHLTWALARFVGGKLSWQDAPERVVLEARLG